ncbi:hypothetical protein DFH27DRAFT_130337 [Peziza echinospora]|nr:hypothetical protein DFH27DRAFT_130337 [Peziza echinospora]
MVTIRGIGASLLGLATLAAAQTSKYCSPVDVCISANIPAAASSSDLYLQVVAPATSGWAGVGFGSRMKGSLIFIIYPTTNGKNLTISPRIATANEMPHYESTIDFTALEGTGIVDGVWTANIHCRNCRKWSLGSVNVKSTAQPMIWAVGTGQKVFSDSNAERISQHASRSTFVIDLVRATGGNTANPFDPNGNGNNTGGGSGSGNETNTGGNEGTGEDGNTGGGEGGSDVGGGSLPLTKADRVLIAHGVLMAIAFLILYPLGSIVIRFIAPYLTKPMPLYLHAGIQFVSFILTLVGFILGLQVGDMHHVPESERHKILGIFVFVFLVIQIPLGWVHHIMYKKTGGRTGISHVHIWNGRLVIVGGIVNGGLGLQAAGIKKKVLGNIEVGLVEKYWVIVYAVVAAVVGVIYFSGWGLLLVKGNKAGGLGGLEKETGGKKEGTLLREAESNSASQRSRGGSSKDEMDEAVEMPRYNPSGRMQTQDYYAPNPARDYHEQQYGGNGSQGSRW